MSEAVDWVSRLGLERHPEGGWFRRIYTAVPTLDTAHGRRAVATSIYYLLDREQPLGRLHRNRSDILHYFLDGGPLEYLLLDQSGVLRRERLGPGQKFLLVAGGCWKASHLVDGAGHALIAEVVTPGFDYADHEFAQAAAMQTQYPALYADLAAFL